MEGATDVLAHAVGTWKCDLANAVDIYIYTVVYIASIYTLCPCIFCNLISTVLYVLFLTLDTHVPEGYSKRSVFVCVCVYERVHMCVFLFVVFCHRTHVDPEIQVPTGSLQCRIFFL